MAVMTLRSSMRGRPAFFSGLARPPEGLRDLAWFTPHGTEMTESDWYAPTTALGAYLSGRELPQRDPHGAPVTDDSFLALLHAGPHPVTFTLPGRPWARGYELLLDTAREEQGAPPGTLLAAGAPIELPERSVLLLRALTSVDLRQKTE